MFHAMTKKISQLPAISLVSWVNVLDYGAVGDGNADDTAAIQAAVTACPQFGTVYFPEGPRFYKITSAITTNSKPLRLLGDRGSGSGLANIGSTLFGSFAGPLFDFGAGGQNGYQQGPGPIVEGMAFVNTVGDGLHAEFFVLVRVANCSFACAGIGCNLANGIISALIENTIFAGSAHMGTALVIDSHATVLCCDFAGHSVGIHAGGPGVIILNCRTENCTTGFLLGKNHAEENRLLTGLVAGCTFEANSVGIDAYQFSGLMTGCAITGGPGAPDGMGATSLRIANAGGLVQNASFDGLVMTTALVIAGTTARVSFRNCTAPTWTIPAGQTGVDFHQCDNPGGGQQIVWASAAPTSGTWGRGDVAYDTTPCAGGAIGWVCVAGGTPGTWKTFGAIGA